MQVKVDYGLDSGKSTVKLMLSISDGLRLRVSPGLEFSVILCLRLSFSVEDKPKEVNSFAHRSCFE